ncbi:MAG: hypothetical protein AB1726_13850 [Planctomycetota bacterium]
MKHKEYILWSALLLPGLLAFSPRGDEVSFHPAEGATLTKTFTSKSEVSLDEMSLTQNGQPVEFGGLEISTTSDQTIQVTDVYSALGDGRPAKLTRTFEKLAGATTISQSHEMMGDQDTDVTSKSELLDKVVVFSWDAEAGEFDVAFAPTSGGDETLLEGLEEDMDLRAFLPRGEVAVDDEWEIDPQDVRGLFAPGGSLKLEPENPEELGMGSGPHPSLDQALGDMEGTVSGTYRGTREEEGVKVAVIELTMEISSAKDLTDLMKEMMGNIEAPGGEEIDMRIGAFDMEFAFEGKGVLLWDVAAGLVHSLDLSGEVTQRIDMQMDMTVAGQELSMENAMTMSGTMTVAVATGRAD